MTKQRTTKRALLLSALSLLMCVSMLIGSTFAWFTDSVTSGNNKIVAGTLQIDLELLEENGSWTSIKESGKAIFDYENWEPGYTDVKILRVSNKGTLALKWLAKFVSNYELSPLADVIDVYVNTTVDAYPENRSDLSGWTKVGTVKEFVNTISATTKGTLEAGASANLGIALKMQETADNRYQGMDLGGTFDIQIIATQYTSEDDSFDNQYDLSAAIYVDSAEEAQAALDNAKKGDVIVLASGNYGTLKLRPVDGNANTTTSLNEANGEGYTVYRNEFIRKVEDLTILGTTNAKVDAIDVVSGYITDSGSSCNLVDIKGLVIDSVEFNDTYTNAPHSYAAPVFFDLSYADVDGLTVKNCKLIGDNDKMNLVYFYSSGKVAYDNVASNITITGNTVDGIARLCELRQTENVTITNNVIKNTVEHGILLTVNEGAFSGNVTITGNIADGIGNRFVRMAGAGDATVVIKDNTITDYMGEDDDYIKVTDSTGTPVIENNTITRVYKVSTSDEVKNILAKESDGTTIYLAAGTYDGLSFINPASYKAKNVTIVGGENVTVNGIAFNGWSSESNVVVDGFTVKNVTFTQGVLLSTVNMKNVTIDGCTFKNDAAVNMNDKTENLTNLVVTDCDFEGVDDVDGETTTAIMIEKAENVTISGCTFTNIDYNALQAGTLTGTVVIDNNRVHGTGNRVFRFVTLNADVTISNNTIVSEGDADGELAKATNACEVTLTNNTWNGKSDAAAADKLINITAK